MSEKLRIYFFIVILCFCCASILAALATLLEKPQEKAKELDRSKQLLIAAKLLSPKGYFLTKTPEGIYGPAIFDKETNSLVLSSQQIIAQDSNILMIYEKSIRPLLVDDQGNTKTFSEANINYNTYLQKNQKSGFANLPLKLIYEILHNDQQPIGYVIPINGFGLWDAIYGYLAIEKNGDTIIGTTWYQQKETAGLGANITIPSWQKQFENKVIFQKSPTGTTNFQTASLGITVVKGKVNEVLPSSPKADSAVDGISGATLTGQGVTKAYAASLKPYRPFLLKLHNK